MYIYMKMKMTNRAQKRVSSPHWGTIRVKHLTSIYLTHCDLKRHHAIWLVDAHEGEMSSVAKHGPSSSNVARTLPLAEFVPFAAATARSTLSWDLSQDIVAVGVS